MTFIEFIIYKFWILYYFLQTGIKDNTTFQVYKYLALLRIKKINPRNAKQCYESKLFITSEDSYINNILQGYSDGKSLKEAINYAKFLNKHYESKEA